MQPSLKADAPTTEQYYAIGPVAIVCREIPLRNAAQHLIRHARVARRGTRHG